MKYFGTSGIRRLADEKLIDIAFITGFSLGMQYRRVLVGTDTRLTNEAVKYALISGLLATGADTYDAGVVPTPTLAKAGKGFDCTAMITASHNPPEYNGIKLLNPDGSPFTASQQQFIENNLENRYLPPVDYVKSTRLKTYTTAVEEHIAAIRKQIPCSFNSIKVVLDPAGGAATSITEKLLREIGCDLTVINGEPAGIFPRPAEPTAENLVQLCEKVKETGAALGIAHDGDADRVMAVDDKGRFIPGDKLLCMFADFYKATELVTTVDASMAIEERGYKTYRCPVGDNNVTEEMLKRNIAFGGETSGAWVFSEMSLCPDGIYGAAVLLELASMRKLSEWADSIPSYPMIRKSIKTTIDFSDLENVLTSYWKNASLDKIDGLKYSFDDAWVLIRKSGTEPKVRITIEGKNNLRVNELYQEAEDFVRQLS